MITSGTILTIDRNRRNLELLAQFLQKEGYATHGVSDLTELDPYLDGDGSNAHLLVETVEVQGPSWSPDGTQIAFLGNEGLSTVFADGTSLTVLRSGPVIQPKWRPAP